MKILSTITLLSLLTLSIRSNAMQRGFEEFVARHPYVTIVTATTGGLGISKLLTLLSKKKASKFTYSSPMPRFFPFQRPNPPSDG